VRGFSQRQCEIRRRCRPGTHLSFAWMRFSSNLHPGLTGLERHKMYKPMEKAILLYRAIYKCAGEASVSRIGDSVARAEEYREIAERVRELDRRSRFREIKAELYDWAYRCDRIADDLKSLRPPPPEAASFESSNLASKEIFHCEIPHTADAR